MMVSSNLPTILCCMCATPMTANAANMCVSCLKNEMDVTEGIAKEITIHQCRDCQRWQRPPWAAAELESRELLAICLKKVTGLNKVKLVDAGWIWTEPHSRRLKLKLTVQKEVLSGTILQQSFVVTFIVRNQQCDACLATFCNSSWKALVQVRQKVDHKRTFYFLEQVILKHRAHEKTNNIQSQPDGVDFFFTERNEARRFIDFLQDTVPTTLTTSKKLISADYRSNTQNFKFTICVDIAPVCKDDLVALPIKLAHNLGHISSLCLVQQLASTIHVVDPLSLQRGEVDNDKYWRYPFRALRSAKALVDFTVLDSNPVALPQRSGRPLRFSPKARLAEVQIVRNSDFGVNDITFTVISHLGNILKAGDTVLGYDLTTAVFNDDDLKPLVESGLELPDVILVRKKFPRRLQQKRHRNWKLKQMEGVEEATPHRKNDCNKEERDYEQFMEDLEEDREMRAQINIYKAHPSGLLASTDEDDDSEETPKIPVHELLDEMTEQFSASLLTDEQAQAAVEIEIEEL